MYSFGVMKSEQKKAIFVLVQGRIRSEIKFTHKFYYGYLYKL